jgi:hypothetical protein
MSKIFVASKVVTLEFYLFKKWRTRLRGKRNGETPVAEAGAAIKKEKV